jgi:hypothetical protein
MTDKKLTREEALAWCKENDPAFVERLEAAVARIVPLTVEQVRALAEAENFACKHCGRCVLAGPPCCYDNVYELYQKTYSEVLFLRKIQSKNAKQIDALKMQIEDMKLHIELRK